jgi:hypothetical protein
MTVVTDLDLPEVDGEPVLGGIEGNYNVDSLPIRWR